MAVTLIEGCGECSGSGKKYIQDWDDRNNYRVQSCSKCGGRGFIQVTESREDLMTVSELIKKLQLLEPWAGHLHVEARNSAGDFDWVRDLSVEDDPPGKPYIKIETDFKPLEYESRNG